MKYKDIEGYEGLYRLYEDGRCWSYRNRKFLVKNLNQDGYYTYTLSKDNVVKNRPLHRWLYLTFVGPIPADRQINHKDGVKTNNALDNLEVVTAQENTRHAWQMGLARRIYPLDKKPSRRRLRSDAKKVYEMRREGMPKEELAGLFGMAPADIDLLEDKYKKYWRAA